MGWAAYVIEKIKDNGLFGEGREGVLEKIMRDWIFDNWGNLTKSCGISIEEAESLGYLIKTEEKNKE